MSTPSESTTYLSIPPADEPTPAPAASETPAEPSLEPSLEPSDGPSDTPSDAGRPEPADAREAGPSTAVLEPIAPPPTIPALPLAPRDPADRPFAAPQRSVPGRPDAWWRRLFRR